MTESTHNTEQAGVRPSKTSIYVAAGRAIGAREPDESVRNPDFLAERLLGDPASLEVDHPTVRALGLDYAEAMQKPEVAGTVIMMIVRTRFIDDQLRRAIEEGASQVVIMGAGFDTRAYRFEELLKHAAVFEVDRPQTQALKRGRVKEVLGAAPANLTYVPMDFEHDDPGDVLAGAGYDPSRKTFFVWEGVTMYLPEEAVRRTCKFVAAQAPGSRLVFDGVKRSVIDWMARLDIQMIPEQYREGMQRFLDLIAKEPWKFGLPDGGERDFLAVQGLELDEILALGSEEATKRYLTRADGTLLAGGPSGQQQTGYYQLLRASVPAG